MGLCYFWLGISSDGVMGIDIRAVFFDASGADALVEKFNQGQSRLELRAVTDVQ
jgi:hypothetical protein